MKPTKVVGKVTQRLRELYAPTEDLAEVFACGFAAGQAEKVYLGACKAAMFRPSSESFEWYQSQVKQIAKLYGLVCTILDSHCVETPYEVWIHRDGVQIGAWLKHEPNSPEWHKLRAEACGIPADEVDVDYHLRSGYGEKCD